MRANRPCAVGHLRQADGFASAGLGLRRTGTNRGSSPARPENAETQRQVLFGPGPEGGNVRHRRLGFGNRTAKVRRRLQAAEELHQVDAVLGTEPQWHAARLSHRWDHLPVMRRGREVNREVEDPARERRPVRRGHPAFRISRVTAARRQPETQSRGGSRTSRAAEHSSAAPPGRAGPAGPAVVSPRFPQDREMVAGGLVRAPRKLGLVATYWS